MYPKTGVYLVMGLRIEPPQGVLPDVYSIIADTHSIHWHEATVKLMVKAALEVGYKRRKLIIAGDMLDMFAFSPKFNRPHYQKSLKNQHGIEDYFIPEVEKEFAWGLMFLEEMGQVFSEIYYIEGNHEYRLDLFVESDCPVAYKHNFDLANGLDLKNKVNGWVGHNEWLDFGSIIVTHGEKHGNRALHNMYNIYSNNFIMAHLHRREEIPFPNKKETKSGYCVPCASTLNPEYMFNRANQWDNGFGVLSIFSDGGFFYNSYLVKDDRTVINGKVLKV